MKEAARRKPPTTTAQYDVERSSAVFAARQQFLNSSINMGWQLALSVVVPVVVGVKLDDHFHTTPSYTLAALVLSVAGAAIVVGSTLKKIRKDQLVQEKKK